MVAGCPEAEIVVGTRLEVVVAESSVLLMTEATLTASGLWRTAL